MANARGVTFRRINGRVVPIVGEAGGNDNLSKADRKHRVKVATAQAAAGAAVAAGTGKGVSEMVRRSSSAYMKGTAQYKVARGKFKATLYGENMTKKLATKAMAQGTKMKAGVRMRAMGAAAYKLRTPALAAGAVVASGLFAASAINASEGVTGKKVSSQKAARVGATAAAVGALAVGAAYYHGLKIGGVKKIAENAFAHVQGKPRPHKAPWWNRQK